MHLTDNLLPSYSLGAQWKLVALGCAMLLVTFWSGTILQNKSTFDAVFQEQSLEGKGALSSDSSDPLLAKAAAGSFSGIYDNHGYRVWRSIQFGLAPLRFSSPELKTFDTSQIYDTNFTAPQCPQKWDGGSYFSKFPDSWEDEDCLYLAVLAPGSKSESSDGYPVVVYFHSGGFDQGLGTDYPGDDLSTFVKNGIVAVDGNYRVGPFGFTVTRELQGNYAIEDQILLLQWVNKNIHAFGGDPKKVTIMGESAGAQSVALHLSCPSSRGLFSGAVLMSNAAGLPYPTKEEAISLSESFFTEAGCSNGNVTCMRSKTWQELVNGSVAMHKAMETAASSDGLVPIQITSPYVPYVEVGGLLPYQPYFAIKTGQIPDVPILYGFDRDEGAYFIFSGSGAIMTREEYPLNAQGFVHSFITHNATSAKTFELAEEIQTFYNFTSDITDGRVLLSEILTDAFFVCPDLDALQTVHKYNTQPVYFYMYDYVNEYTLNQTSNPARFFVEHGSEKNCVFDAVNSVCPGHYAETPAEREMCSDVNTAFSNFIKNGDPSVGDAQGIPWVPLGSKGEFVSLGMQSEVITYSRIDLCHNFWNKVGSYPNATINATRS